MGQNNIGIDQFVADFDGGSRPTLYKVSIQGGDPANFTERLSFYCKATSLPASTLGEIIVPYMGRQIKVPGDRTFEDWTVTILNTEDMDLRGQFEQWNHYYNGIIDNKVFNDGPFWGHVKPHATGVIANTPSEFAGAQAPIRRVAISRGSC